MVPVRAAHIFGAIVALQVLFAVIIAIVSSTALTGSDGACYLNLSGDTCDFLAITAYFSLLFSLLSGLGAAATLRAGPGALLAPANGSLACFASLWWLAAAVTATQRGKQAGEQGLPAGAARGGVTALAWLQFVLCVAAMGAVAFDLIMRKQRSVHAAHAAPMLGDVEGQPEFQQATFPSARSH